MPLKVSLVPGNLCCMHWHTGPVLMQRGSQLWATDPVLSCTRTTDLGRYARLCRLAGTQVVYRLWFCACCPEVLRSLSMWLLHRRQVLRLEGICCCSVEMQLYFRARVLHFAGADLDPLQVLSALSPEMPLSTGVDILSHLMCERLHRHRQGSIIRSLHKACSLSASVHRAEVLPSSPVGTDTKHECSAPLG